MKALLVISGVIGAIIALLLINDSLKNKKLKEFLAPKNSPIVLTAVEFSGQQRKAIIKDIESLAYISKIIESKQADTSVYGPTYSLGLAYSVSFYLTGNDRIDTLIYMRKSLWSIAGELDSVGDNHIYAKKLTDPIPINLLLVMNSLNVPK